MLCVREETTSSRARPAAAGSSVQKAEPAAAAVAQAAGADSHLFLLFVYASPSRTTTASWFLFLTESSEGF